MAGEAARGYSSTVPEVPTDLQTAPAARASGVTLEGIATSALRTLRAYPGTAMLVAATGAAALTALLPVAVLVAPGWTALLPRLHLAPVRGGDLGLALSSLAATPSEIRAETLAALFRLLLAVAAGVLVVSWITTFALAAARAVARGAEMRVRRAVGASRPQLLATELLEGVLIAAPALAAGDLAGFAAARVGLGTWPGWAVPGSRALAVAGVAAMGAALLVAALMPLVFARRSSPVRDAGPATLSLVLPTVQLGLALTVLVAGALLGEAGTRLAAGPGAPRRGGGGGGGGGGHVFEIAAREPRSEARAAAYSALLARLRSDSLTASLASPGTVIGLGPVSTVGTDCGPCRWAGGPLYLSWHTFAATHYLVSADTFRALAIPVVAGRGFTAGDRWGAPRVAVVNRTLAERHYFRGQALGRAIAIGVGADALYTVVGVVGDRAPAGFGGGFEPAEQVYLSVLQHPAREVELLVRPAARGAAALRSVSAALGRGGAAVASLREATLFRAEAAPVRWFARMFDVEGGVLLVIAALGTFAVMWLWVDSLLGEIGVRRATGARRRHVLGYVLARAALVSAGGVAVGCWMGMALWDEVGALVPGLPAWDPHAVLRFGLLLAAAALAGAAVPARRAARATPAALLAT